MFPHFNSYENWALLCEHLCDLIRADMPLGDGMESWGRSKRGRIGRVSITVGRSLNQGKSIRQAFDAPEIRTPLTLKNCINAGLKHDCLLAALESAGEDLRFRANWRYDTRIAWLYPIIVLTVGYICILVTLKQLVPPLIMGHQMIDPEIPGWLNVLNFCRETIFIWSWIPPVVALVLLTIAIFYKTWKEKSGGGVHGNWQSSRLHELAKLTFVAGLAAKLSKSKMPKESLEIAADAHGWRGTNYIPDKTITSTYSVNVWWQILSNSANEPAAIFAGSLTTIAIAIRENVEQQRRWWMVYFPAQLTLAVGISVITFYLMIGLIPWLSLLNKFSIEL